MKLGSLLEDGSDMFLQLLFGFYTKKKERKKERGGGERREREREYLGWAGAKWL
jgi:hypothetical protein